VNRVEHFELRRRKAYFCMLIALIAILAMIFAEVFSPGWACRITRCPSFILGGNPFLAAALIAGVVISVILAVIEAGIDREKLRGVIDDERRVLIKLKGWRNAYFSAVAGLFLFVVLSDSSPAVTMPFLLGAVMVSGAIGLFATMLLMDRE
jgi:hypothetical protein